MLCTWAFLFFWLLVAGAPAPADEKGPLAGVSLTEHSAAGDSTAATLNRHRGYQPVIIWVAPVSRINWYAYAGGDPVNRWDPTGLDWEWVGNDWIFAGGDKDVPKPKKEYTPQDFGTSFISWNTIGTAVNHFDDRHAGWRHAFTDDSISYWEKFWERRVIGTPGSNSGPVMILPGAVRSGRGYAEDGHVPYDLYVGRDRVWQSGTDSFNDYQAERRNIALLRERARAHDTGMKALAYTGLGLGGAAAAITSPLWAPPVAAAGGTIYTTAGTGMTYVGAKTFAVASGTGTFLATQGQRIAQQIQIWVSRVNPNTAEGVLEFGVGILSNDPGRMGQGIPAAGSRSLNTIGELVVDQKLIPFSGVWSFLNKIGLRRHGGYTNIQLVNYANPGSKLFHEVMAHEGLHRWVVEKLPILRQLGDAPLGSGAPFKYLEEVAAYTRGSWAAGERGRALLSPFRAFMYLEVKDWLVLGGLGGSAAINQSVDDD